MKLAYSSNAYTRTSLERALASISAIGFDGAEILCDHPHLFPGRTSDTEVAMLKRQLTGLGLAVSNLNANTANGYFDPLPPENVFEPSLSSANRVSRDWRTRFSIAAVRIARELGASCISLTSGHPGSGGLPDQGLAYFTDSLKRICEVAEDQAIKVGIEYEPGLLVERAHEVMEVIERVGSSHLGVNLDIGHSHLNHEPPEEAVATLSGRIWNVHVEDIANHKHFHLVPGDGDMPLKRYLQALKREGYDNHLTVELYTYTHMPEEAGRRSLGYLRKLLKECD
jgi:sugar phosphate isomerase/epimerase